MSENSKLTETLLRLLLNKIPVYNKQRKRLLKTLKRHIRETYPEIPEGKILEQTAETNIQEVE